MSKRARVVAFVNKIYVHTTESSVSFKSPAVINEQLTAIYGG